MTLACRPPLSRPVALVSWFKNSHLFPSTDHVTLLHNGDLFFHRHVCFCLCLQWTEKAKHFNALGNICLQCPGVRQRKLLLQGIKCPPSTVPFLKESDTDGARWGSSLNTWRHFLCRHIVFIIFFNQRLLLTPAPPSVRVWPQMVTVPIGARVLLECKVSGQPVPFISWMKRGHSKHTGGRTTVG